MHAIVDVRLNLDFIDPSPESENPNANAALSYDYIEDDVLRGVQDRSQGESW